MQKAPSKDYSSRARESRRITTLLAFMADHIIMLTFDTSFLLLGALAGSWSTRTVAIVRVQLPARSTSCNPSAGR